jgi:hypothetical protein
VGRKRGAPGASRGAITVESALVVASILVFVLGMLQFGLLGFIQITVDAGAFLNAHQNAIGVNDVLGPADATHKVFNQIQSASITNTVQTAPSPLVPVNYGYNGTTAQQTASGTNRHGGASVLQPYIAQTTIVQNVFSFLNQSFTVHGQASEANWLESEPYFNVGNASYGSPYSATNTQLNTSVFTQGENTPLFYMSLNYVHHCETPGTWGNSTGSSRGVCPSPDTMVYGVGEYLDTTNWAIANPGIGGSPTCAGAYGCPGTFEAAACHQRMLSTIVFFFQYLKGNYAGNSAPFATDPLAWLEKAYNPYYFNQSGYTNFRNANFFAQAVNGYGSDAIDGLANNAIKTIYGWDVDHGYYGSGGLYGVGNNPLSPTAGCV